MGEEGSSRKNKKGKNPSYVQAGSLSCLAKKKRMSLTTKEPVQAIRSEKEQLLKLMEEQPTIGARSEANERHVEEQFVEGHIVDEQMQIDSTSPTTNERSEEQASGSRSSEINKENRKKSTDPHTVGKTSFAVIRNELEKTKESISFKEMFVATRARKPGRLYKDSDENTTSKIAEMEKNEIPQSVDGSQSVDAFSSVMGPEHPGRLRLYGRGVTKTNLKGKVGHFEPTLNATNDTLQEMQERIRKMEEQMEEQRRTMRKEITADVIAQLQRAGLINPNILATLSVSSLGEATSAPQAANQLIRRPSERSNNQGGKLQVGDKSAKDLT